MTFRQWLNHVSCPQLSSQIFPGLVMKQSAQRRIHNGQVWPDLVILGLLLIPLS
jgi:hypothetical protein